MKDGWSETLKGPCSLLTGPDIAITAAEDPAFIVLHLSDKQTRLRDALSHRFNVAFSNAEGEISPVAPDGFLLRRSTEEWWMVRPRVELAGTMQILLSHQHNGLLATDLTGHFAALKLAGSAQEEILRKVADSSFHYQGDMMEFEISGARCLAFGVSDGKTTYLLLLIPRSCAVAVAERLVASAAVMPRIGLFGVKKTSY
jgi:hypothetical protein